MLREAAMAFLDVVTLASRRALDVASWPRSIPAAGALIFERPVPAKANAVFQIILKADWSYSCSLWSPRDKTLVLSRQVSTLSAAAGLLSELGG